MPSVPPLNPLPDGEARANPGLPTVTPPSGSMFIRLFGVPALIVGGLVLLLIVGQPLVGKFSRYFLGRTWGSASPEQFLRDLDNNNKEVRWRAANDLAQVLLRDDALASDSAFALQLEQRLRRMLDSSAPFEKAYAEHFAKLAPDEKARELAQLGPDRDYILLLVQCLGHFMVPVGASVLEELAMQQSGLELRALSARRRQALWALANLGENLKRFEKLPVERQEAVLSQLEAAAGEGQVGAAKEALAYLKIVRLVGPAPWGWIESLRNAPMPRILRCENWQPSLRISGAATPRRTPASRRCCSACAMIPAQARKNLRSWKTKIRIRRVGK